jgi:hypothetical protein
MDHVFGMSRCRRVNFCFLIVHMANQIEEKREGYPKVPQRLREMLISLTFGSKPRGVGDSALVSVGRIGCPSDFGCLRNAGGL